MHGNIYICTSDFVRANIYNGGGFLYGISTGTLINFKKMCLIILPNSLDFAWAQKLSK